MRESTIIPPLIVLAALGAGACSRPKPAPALVVREDARFDFRPTPWEAFPGEEEPKRHVVEDLLCPGTCDPLCQSLEPREAALCALDLAYADDAEARSSAKELFERTGVVPGMERAHDIDAAYLGRIAIEPVLPTGEHRRHLTWLRDALAEIDRTFAAVARRAQRPLMFRTRPLGFRFFRTSETSYPSAYAIEGIVGYNVAGPLHDSPEKVTSTLIHEVFHLNDEGHGQWSETVLEPIFARIVETCGDDDECLTPYAPVDDRVEGGTYYAFDSRTRDVREYGAELALRWFREARSPDAAPPFKCGTEENQLAWRALVDEFFGGFDPSPACQ